MSATIKVFVCQVVTSDSIQLNYSSPHRFSQFSGSSSLTHHSSPKHVPPSQFGRVLCDPGSSNVLLTLQIVILCAAVLCCEAGNYGGGSGGYSSGGYSSG